ncbi:MAG: hypothetical protein U0V72_02965 [Cytophagales bacterium]
MAKCKQIINNYFCCALLLFAIHIVSSCDNNSKNNEKGWTPVDSNLIDEPKMPEVIAPKPQADSVLSDFLPVKIYDYIADEEIQNSDNKTADGKTLRSVVRVYRKLDKMIGINVTDFSQLNDSEKKDVFLYHYHSLDKLNKSKKGEIFEIKIDNKSNAKGFYSKQLNKSIMFCVINNELLVSISSDSQISIQNFKNIYKNLDIKKLELLKNI